jgi:DNA-binding NarL/FixJ family response regulator
MRIAITRMNKRDRIRQLLERGLSCREVARQLDISKSTVSYHKRRLGHTIDSRCNRRRPLAVVRADEPVEPEAA